MSKPKDTEKIDELILAQNTLLTTMQVISIGSKRHLNDHFTDDELKMLRDTMRLERIYRDAFPKMLLLSIGSNFEYRVVEILKKIFNNSCSNSFFFNKMIKSHILGTMNFSKIIDIPKNNSKFYNAIKIQYGDYDNDDDKTSIDNIRNNAKVVSKQVFQHIEGFHQFIQGKIDYDGDSDFGKNIVSFASIMARRNLLIHNNLLYYNENKIEIDEIQELYQCGNKFLDDLYQLIEQFQAMIVTIKNSNESEMDVLHAIINEKYQANIDKNWIDKFRCF